MDKLKMQTANKADENFKKLAEMFPNAVTEAIDENGEVVRAIDKDVLMQEIACTVVDGNEERYQFTWPDKKFVIMKQFPPGQIAKENPIAAVAALILTPPKISILRATTSKC